MANVDAKQNKLLLVLIVLVGSVLIYLMFGQQIKNILRANQVLKEANSNGVGYYYLRCEEEHYPGDNVDSWSKCLDITKYYKDRAKKEWEPLIKKYGEINCSDFSYKNDAQEFYEYYGGGTYNSLLKAQRDGYRDINGNPLSLTKWMESFADQDSGKVLFSLSDLEKRYHFDPYNLDEDNDGSVCEILPSKPLNERDQPWYNWNTKM